MEDLTKAELREMLIQVIKVYKKLQYSNGHEYFTEIDAEKKIFTVADSKKMDEIIRKLNLDK